MSRAGGNITHTRETCLNTSCRNDGCDEKPQSSDDNPDCILIKKSIQCRQPSTIAHNQTYGAMTTSLVYSLHWFAIEVLNYTPTTFNISDRDRWAFREFVCRELNMRMPLELIRAVIMNIHNHIWSGRDYQISSQQVCLINVGIFKYNLSKCMRKIKRPSDDPLKTDHSHWCIFMIWSIAIIRKILLPLGSNKDTFM